jgi:hypothetical protein
MDRPRFSDSSGEDRAREPIFRSDLEERRPVPEYPRSEGGFWSTIKRLFAPLAVVGV